VNLSAHPAVLAADDSHLFERSTEKIQYLFPEISGKKKIYGLEKFRIITEKKFLILHESAFIMTITFI
jgi:hypothetical protein